MEKSYDHSIEDEYTEYGDEKSALVSKSNEPTDSPHDSSPSSSSSPTSTDNNNNNNNNAHNTTTHPTYQTIPLYATDSRPSGDSNISNGEISVSIPINASSASNANSSASSTPNPPANSTTNSRQRNSARLRSNVQGNVRRMSRGSKIFLMITLIYYFLQIATIVVVLSMAGYQECDTPLRLFLIMYGSKLAFTVPLVVYNRFRYNPGHHENRTRTEVAMERLQNFLDFFGTVWFVVGNWWLFTSTTCNVTSPILYYTSFAYILLGYFVISIPLLMCLAMICCLPCVLYVLRNIKDETNNGASEEIIKALPLEKYVEGSMDKEDAVCVICLNEYTNDENIKRLPCNHHFHPNCIDEWLHINKHCPLCMGNIDPNEEKTES